MNLKDNTKIKTAYRLIYFKSVRYRFKKCKYVKKEKMGLAVEELLQFLMIVTGIQYLMVFVTIDNTELKYR